MMEAFMPFGDAGSPARFFYCAKVNKRERGGSKHPCIKPLKLMEWLVKLVTPPGGTVLEPFAGSGTTGLAACMNGFNVVLIEQEEGYVSDIKRRLAPWIRKADPRVKPEPSGRQDIVQTSKPEPTPVRPHDADRRIVLSLCDRTTNIVQPWAEAGYTCYCVDIQFPEGEHRHGNIILVGADVRTWQPPPLRYAIVFAQPPCTNLAVSGAAWFQSKGLRGLIDGLELVEACQRVCDMAKAPYMIENPVSTLSTYRGKPDFNFHPFEFGGYPGGHDDGYTKKTCLWTGGGFLHPERRPIPVTKPNYIKHMPPSTHRSDLRSVTPKGFARAIFEANVGQLGRTVA
jgi:hypothetical protein